MNTCEAGWIGSLVNLGARHDWTGEIYRACHREAVTAITSGCIHEHVETWKVCTPCQQAILRRAAHDRYACPLCLPSHVCRVLLNVPQLAVTR